MQSLSYSGCTAKKRAEPYRSGTFLTPPLFHMPNDKDSKQESSREPFPTIDRALEVAQELQNVLKKLAELKHPLDVRKARKEVVRTMQSRGDENRESKQIRAGSRTYFIDIEKTKDGKPYLRITESRFKGEGSGRERNSIAIFPEEADEFAAAINEMVAKLG